MNVTNAVDKLLQLSVVIHLFMCNFADNYGLTVLNGFSFLVIFLSFIFGSCGRLNWLNSQLSSAR